jgi:NAD-dependent SIR2 family protein deacetylase
MPMHPLQQFIEAHPRLFVLTGAGCSTDSGIPDYRDRDGQWKRPPPVNYAAFMHEPATRQRYWARSMVGWRRFGSALPNTTHHALAELEQRGQIELLVTQNVDRLHQRAGSERVLDLHGRLDEVRCMSCDWRLARRAFQQTLVERNPAWAQLDATDAPDGDADLEGHDFARFDVPPCPHCGGTVKPDVVFFGEAVPRERVEAATRAWQAADAVLVVGSSLMVYSGYRFVDAAARAGKPVAAVTLGRTRADALLTLKIDAPCHEALAFLREQARLVMN